jgi:dTDP-4-dehydrorhamnose reductase
MASDKRPALIIGAYGQLGTAISHSIPERVRVGREDLDLGAADLHQRARQVIRAVKPKAIINCAAFTAVDQAESNFAEARKVNGEAVGILAKIADEHSTPFVTFSTDYVFDGNKEDPYVESDPTSPLNAYGQSKALGERLALSEGRDVLVIRTSWIISGTHSNFVATILRRLRESSSVRVVTDQYGCPTIASDLAQATVQALEAGVSGILHLTNRGATTWYELARAAAERAGFAERLVEPCVTADYPTLARRPRRSHLGSERTSSLGIELPHWQESIDLVVRDLVATR